MSGDITDCRAGIENTMEIDAGLDIGSVKILMEYHHIHIYFDNDTQLYTGRYPYGYLPILFVCVDRWTEDNGKKGVSVAVFSCYAGRLRYAGHLLRAYVATQRTLAPVTVRQHDSTATNLEN